MRWSLAFMVLAVWTGCGRASSPPATADAQGGAVPAAPDSATRTPASTTARPLDAIVDDWVSGQRDGAVKRLVAEVSSTTAVEVRRLYSISEAEFAAKPPAERDALRASVAARTSALLQIAREALRQAKSQTAEGNAAAARETLETLRGVGDANRGPAVLTVLDLAGQKIFEEADQALTSLGAQADSHTGPGTP